MKVSIVIRAFNEARYLAELLRGIQKQRAPGLAWEVVLVDSGSTDDTVAIAAKFGCRITHIAREEFSFGRSLNLGCRVATGDAIVFISGHCIPVGDSWLAALVAPLVKGDVVWTYGRQIGNHETYFSEHRIFAKYYPATSQVPQTGFFCNNANAALLKHAWDAHRFDEELTGLEDMCLGKRLVSAGMKIGYVAEAVVVHIHTETWAKVKTRFEREAIALQRIMPEVHISFGDFVRYLGSSVLLDVIAAMRERSFMKNAWSIIRYRSAQYLGSYRGNHSHRKLSRERKEQYFYPR